MNIKEIYPRIEQRLKALGISENVANGTPGAKDGVRNMKRAVKAGEFERGVNITTIDALAPVLQTTPHWLLFGILEDRVSEVFRRVEAADPANKEAILAVVEAMLTAPPVSAAIGFGDLPADNAGNRHTDAEGPMRVMQVLFQARPIFEASAGSEPSPPRSPAVSGKRRASPKRKSPD